MLPSDAVLLISSRSPSPTKRNSPANQSHLCVSKLDPSLNSVRGYGATVRCPVGTDCKWSEKEHHCKRQSTHYRGTECAD